MGKIQCEICRKKCKGDVLKLDKKFIHKACFSCYQCNKNLEKGEFFCRDNRYLCMEDYQKQYGVKCGMCNKYADGEIVTILGGTFHIQCFQCQNCSSPFRCGDKAILWDGIYLCQKCAMEKQEKENIDPPLSDQKSITESDIVLQATETPIIVRNVMANPYDSSDTDGPMNIKPKECLQLHIENGYTSTDSGVEKTKSEVGYLSQHSPCYSLSSGDESWMRSSRGRKSRAKTSYNYGRYLNPSYLEIQDRIVKHTPPKAVYCGSNRNPSSAPVTSHFHRPENFSYRSSPNINMRKGMSLLANPFGQAMKQSLSGRFHKVSRPQSANDINLSEEVKRLAHYPDGKIPEVDYAPPIDRFDFPAPPSVSVVLQDKKKERELKTQQSIMSTGDICSDTLSGTDTTAELGDFSESEAEKARKKKVELTFKFLRETGKYSGLSQTVLDQLEKNEMRSRKEYSMDPISASRSPDASVEPPQKTRYERHTFTSPSRDNRYEGRPTHSLSYRTQYSNTGGRTGTLPLYNPSNPQPGYIQGYMSCTEDSSRGRGTDGLNYRALSLPRPLNIYNTPHCVNNTNYLLDGHMSPSMTTSGYSVDVITHSIDESTLIGGSGILNSAPHRDGYMSDMAPSSVPYGQKKSRPDWFYESDNEAIFHSNYPTVQSYLKPSNMLRTKQKIPAEVHPYEKLKISNFSLPKGVDRSKLEDHLTNEDFTMVFQMSRVAFSRLPEWKRNDIKRKVDLY